MPIRDHRRTPSPSLKRAHHPNHSHTDRGSSHVPVAPRCPARKQIHAPRKRDGTARRRMHTGTRAARRGSARYRGNMCHHFNRRRLFAFESRLMSAAVAKNILLVVAHPEAKSFVCALANTAAETLTAAGHTVVGTQAVRAVSELPCCNFSSDGDPRCSHARHVGGLRALASLRNVIS